MWLWLISAGILSFSLTSQGWQLKCACRLGPFALRLQHSSLPRDRKVDRLIFICCWTYLYDSLYVSSSNSNVKVTSSYKSKIDQYWTIVAAFRSICHINSWSSYDVSILALSNQNAKSNYFTNSFWLRSSQSFLRKWTLLSYVIVPLDPIISCTPNWESATATSIENGLLLGASTLFSPVFH